MTYLDRPMPSATVDDPRATTRGNGAAPRVGVAAPPRPGHTEPEQAPPVLPWPLRPPRRVAGIPVGLLVCWQAALLLALVAIGRPAGSVIALGTGAALVIVATGLRPRGRWVHEWVVLWLRYTLRGHWTPDPRQAPALALLDLAATTDTIGEVEVDGEELAVISHAHGYATVLELRTDTLSPYLPLTLAPRHQPDTPLVSVQLVVHATPVVPGTPVATVRTWLAVQVARDPSYQPEELRGALVNAVRRLQRRLRATQLEAQPVDRSQLVEALHTLTRLDHAGPPPPGSGGNVPAGTERWRAWWTRGVPQESVAVRSWPGSPGPPGAALFEVLLSPRWPQTVSIASRRMRLATAHGALQAGDEVLAVELVVRVSERDRSMLGAAVRQLCDRLRAAGVGVERLDGRQLPALAATMPTGGFLSGYAPAASAFPAPPRRAARQLRAQPEYTAGAPAGRIPPPLQRDAVPPPPPPPPAPPPPARPAAGPPPMAPPPQVRQDPPPFLQPAPAGRVPSSPPAPNPLPAAPPATPPPAPGTPEPIEIRPLFPARGQAEVPVAAEPPWPVRGQAAVPPPEPFPVRGQAQVPDAGARAGGSHRAEPEAGYFATTPEPTTSNMPTALRGVAVPPPPPAPPPHVPVHPQSPPPTDVPDAVRAYGASLFTTESRGRTKVEQLMTLVRTPHRSAQVVAVVSGASGLGASTTAAGMARILATVRDDYTALLGAATGRVNAATIQEVSRGHAFVVVDLGAHAGEATPQALTVSTRVVVVTSADKYDAAATRVILDRIHQVKPMLVAGAVIAVVCKTGRQYRRVLRELSADHTPQATQIIPVPADAALRTMEDLDLTRLAQATREAYLRLAAAVATPRPAAAGGAAASTPAVPPR